MKPDLTLIFPKSEFLLDQAVFPPLGIMYLSAYAKQHGLTVQCLDFGIGHTPEMAESDIIGISFTTPQRDEAFKLAKRFKMEGKKVIAGGPHATHLPQECLSRGFTHVARGQGETVMMKFMTNMLGQNIPFDLRPGIDDYPFPDRDALPIRRYHYKVDDEPATPIMTTRGCPFSCAFCGKIDSDFKMQSAAKTIAEMDHIHEKYGFKAFMIFDDVFVASKKRLSEMADAIGNKYALRCFARSNLLDNETCRLLKKLGIVEVGIGIESGSTKILKKNMKGTTRGQNTNAVKRLHEHGIRAKAFLIVGLPGETDETVIETANWMYEANPDDVDVSVFQPMPGSNIFANPEKWGIQYEYNGKPGWFKGTPGDYESIARTEGLSSSDIVMYREMLEEEFKRPELLK